jgi:peptidoglycan/LPS O-acetylase OafA/YrhL
MLYHLAAVSWAVPQTITAQILLGAAKYPEIFSASWFGFVGVEIFFVISGFVITLSAETASPSRFLRSRIARLYPAVWICAPLSALAIWLAGAQSNAGILKELLKSISLYPFPPWVDSVYWTLGIEMTFYLAVLIFLIFGLFGRVQVFAYFIGSISSSYWLLGSMLWPEFIRANLWNRMLELSLVNYGIYFSLGILAFTIFRKGLSALKIAFCFLLFFAASIEISFKVEHNNLLFQTHEPAAVPISAFAIVLAAMVATIKWEPSGQTARRLRLVGLSTYPLYLVHDHFGAFALRAITLVGFPRYLALATAMALCIAISIVIAAWVEPPVQRAVKYSFDRMSKPA